MHLLRMRQLEPLYSDDNSARHFIQRIPPVHKTQTVIDEEYIRGDDNISLGELNDNIDRKRTTPFLSPFQILPVLGPN